MRLTALCLAAVAAVAAIPPLHAQKGKVPKRPVLEIDADTNDATEYYQYGVTQLGKDPQRAADAFYWASRIDPTWAQPLYARRIALFMVNPHLLIGYMSRNRRFLESKEARSIDSLELRARMLNPFLVRDQDLTLIVAYEHALFEEELRSEGEPIDGAASSRFDYFVERYLRTEASDWTRGMVAVSERRLPDALKLYARALSSNRDDAAELHVNRAQVFYVMGSSDSAAAELGSALAALRAQDVKKFVYIYESKAVLEQSVGMIHEQGSNAAAAREAYGRALQEDLSYYPAHVRLALMALAAGDTAATASELELAAQVKTDDPWVQATCGATLAQMGRVDEAAAHLAKAVELEPFYAVPYYLLGRVAEAANKPAEAVEHYRAYLAHASQREPRRADAKQRLVALGAPAAGRP